MRIRVFLEKKFDPPAPFVEAIPVSKGLHISKLVDAHAIIVGETVWYK